MAECAGLWNLADEHLTVQTDKGANAGLMAVASRFLIAVAGLTQLLRSPAGVAMDAAASHGYALLDVDDTIIEVHGHAKQGAGFGYSGVRGLNALPATLTIAGAVPVIVAHGSARGRPDRQAVRRAWSATHLGPHGGCSSRAG